MKYLIAFGLLCYSPLLLAQITHPKASPFSQLTQQIGLSTITIEYSRPARKGRKIFGDLVPYGRIWRVGANESTKFTADTDIIVKGKILPKGTYALYAFPGQASWELVFHSNISHWGDGRDAYNPAEDVFRITVIPRTIPYLQENFLITFDLLDHNSATMKWIWEHTEIRIPIKVPTDDLMMQRIKEKLRDAPGAQTYYEAARYLQEQQKDLTTALGYLEKAIILEGDTYYFHRVKSLVEAGMGDYKAAIKSAQLSLKLAEKEEKDEFVRMNEKNIITWKTMLKD